MVLPSHFLLQVAVVDRRGVEDAVVGPARRARTAAGRGRTRLAARARGARSTAHARARGARCGAPCAKSALGTARREHEAHYHRPCPLGPAIPQHSTSRLPPPARRRRRTSQVVQKRRVEPRPAACVKRQVGAGPRRQPPASASSDWSAQLLLSSCATADSGSDMQALPQHNRLLRRRILVPSV